MKRLHIILLSAAILISFSASAQSFRTGYFLDDYVYGYRINPAQVNDKSFVGVVIGSLDLQNNSNLGLSSFLYPSGGKLVTGLNQAVSASQFLGNLKPNSSINLDETITLLSLGFSNGERMHTIEVNTRAINTENLPRDLFAFLKKGGEATYDIGDLYMDASAMIDLAYGYSRHLGDQLSVGGRVHLLIGSANVNANANGTKLTLSSGQISINSDVDLRLSGLLNMAKSAGGSLDLNKFGFGGSPVAGFGAALDLGVEYKPIEGLEATFSITDLGFISWKNNISAKASGTHAFSGGTIKYEGGNVQTDFEDALNNLKSAFDFKEVAKTSQMNMMPMTITAGAKYRMPFYDKLSAGALFTYRSAKYASWFDFRAGATITPARIISATANLGVNSFGPTYGAALNLYLGPVNIVLGTDGFIGKMGKFNGIPVPLGGFMQNVHAGLTITF